MEPLLSSKLDKKAFQGGPAGKGPAKENSSSPFWGPVQATNEPLLNPIFPPRKERLDYIFFNGFDLKHHFISLT